MAWAPDYVTTAELRAYATRSTSTVDDVELALAVTAASRAVDRATGRQFGQVEAVEERRYTADWDRRRNRWLVTMDDLMDDTGLVVTVEAGTVTAFELEPVNAAQDGRPWTRLVVQPDSGVRPTGEEHEVAITALWGWASIQDPIKNATLLQGNRFAWRRTAPAGVAGSPETGSEVRLLARLDPDVAVALGPYVRWWAAA